MIECGQGNCVSSLIKYLVWHSRKYGKGRGILDYTGVLIQPLKEYAGGFSVDIHYWKLTKNGRQFSV